MSTKILSASIFGGLSITVIEEEANRVSTEEEGIASMEADDLEAMSFRSHPMLTQNSLVR